MVEQLIKQRMELAGVTQAKLAEASDCTPSQMGLFLKGKSTLNRESFDKCLQYVGIDLSIQSKRIETALEVAKNLKGFSKEAISEMSQKEMTEKSGISAVLALPDVEYGKFVEMVKSGIVDYESTFPYFKSLVLHFHNVGEKVTARTAENSFNNILGLLPLGAMFPIMGAALIGGILSPLGMVMGKLFENKTFPKSAISAWTPLLTITYSLLKNKSKK